MTSDFSKVHSLKAAIFHTMAFKLSLEFNRNKVTPKSLSAFLKVLYNVTQIKKKNITFEQYSRIHLEGPKIAICETKRCQMSFLFLIHPSLQKITIFAQLYKKQPTLSTICSKILAIHKNWKYMTRFNIKLIHRNNILYCHKQYTYILSLFKYISSSLLHPSSMMPRDVVDDHSSKELLLQR